MLTGLLRTRAKAIRAPGVQDFARWTSTTAKPRVLMLDPINLAKAELATLEKEATLIVSYGELPTAERGSLSRARIAPRSSAI